MQVSKEVEHVFILPYFMYVWPQLRKIGFDTEQLAKQFWDNHKEKGNGMSPNLYFLKWGVEVLQPMMNKKLNRPEDHPTFIKMMDYLMKPFIVKDPYLNKVRLNK